MIEVVHGRVQVRVGGQMVPLTISATEARRLTAEPQPLQPAQGTGQCALASRPLKSGRCFIARGGDFIQPAADLYQMTLGKTRSNQSFALLLVQHPR